MLHYTLGYLYEKTGLVKQAKLQREAGQQAASDYCFPNTLFDLEVLTDAVTARPEDDKAHYYLGNWYYDKKRPEAAIQHWETSRANQGEFATVHRNLALAYFNKQHDPQAALASLEKAFACQTGDARVFFELDQL